MPAMYLRQFSVCLSILWAIGAGSSSQADGPADNQAASVRPVPPPGIAISAEERTQLDAELKTLNQQIQKLRDSKSLLVKDYLPDVEIFARAVSIALAEDGFFETRDVGRAKDVLSEGSRRATALEHGSIYWIDDWVVDARGESKPQVTVRGFRSKLDGTVQPYGIVNRAGPKGTNVRADIWCRGRSEKGLELQFIATRMSSTDPMPAPGTLMIHPFGRYCNANKLAGEVDTLEVLEHALQQYPIDPKRVAIRGFSMGGAAAWHLAVHYPDKWFAANPGAGFSETPLFLRVFQSEDLNPSWYEQKLWQLYDCPIWVRNLRMLPTIAYSGEIDRQKQAADVMAEASWSLPDHERFELTHIIAPRTAHKIDPVARNEIEKRLATLDRIRSNEPPERITFTTTTLKYNKSHWLTIHKLGEHWVPANVTAAVNGDTLQVFTENVEELSIEFEAGQMKNVFTVMMMPYPFEDSNRNRIHNQPPVRFGLGRKSDNSLGLRVKRQGRSWTLVSPIEPAVKELIKKHDLQGPIDDAFMGPFLFVKPSNAGRYPAVDKWVESEFQRAVKEWRRQMRGEARIKSSEELKPEDIENNHLVLWGDSQSNPTLAKIADQLPIHWNRDQIEVAGSYYSAKTHVPVMIYPNPLNPDRYVVLNSSFTYREYDYLNNARQIPKLPDWAIVDITTPPNSQWPGKVIDANFFGERWEIK
ncbi:MAG: prolyl oligopeptidase family serine peptidase [Pirellula sp.]